jgi:hypothetical protein
MKLSNKFLSIIVVPTRKALGESQKASNPTARKVSEADKIAMKLTSSSKGNILVMELLNDNKAL